MGASEYEKELTNADIEINEGASQVSSNGLFTSLLSLNSIDQCQTLSDAGESH